MCGREISSQNQVVKGSFGILHQRTCTNGRLLSATSALIEPFFGLQCTALVVAQAGHSKPSGQRISKSQLAQASSSGSSETQAGTSGNHTSCFSWIVRLSESLVASLDRYYSKRVPRSTFRNPSGIMFKKPFRKTRRASRKDIKAYLKACANLIGRVKALLLDLAAKEVSPKIINKIMYFVMHAVRQIDQIDRRLLKGETIPQNEKVFSIFEPHTRWISKGKAGCPVELGVPVCIIEDPYQFILHHEVMWTGSDVDFAVPIVEITKELFPDFCAASFDRGFHSPANRVRLDELLVDNVLPKKGRLSKADREREQGETFAAMRRQHPAVESAINNLEHRGLDRVRSKGRKGFARSVALAVVALNVHRLGRVLRQQALERHRPAA